MATSVNKVGTPSGPKEVGTRDPEESRPGPGRFGETITTGQG